MFGQPTSCSGYSLFHFSHIFSLIKLVFSHILILEKVLTIRIIFFSLIKLFFCHWFHIEIITVFTKWYQPSGTYKLILKKLIKQHRSIKRSLNAAASTQKTLLPRLTTISFTQVWPIIIRRPTILWQNINQFLSSQWIGCHISDKIIQVLWVHARCRVWLHGRGAFPFQSFYTWRNLYYVYLGQFSNIKW